MMKTQLWRRCVAPARKSPRCVTTTMTSFMNMFISEQRQYASNGTGRKKMIQPADDDPIIAEIRRFREEYLARFGYDWDLIAQDLRNVAKDWPAGRVSFDKNDPNRNR